VGNSLRGAQALEKFGETLPQELLDSILRNKVALKGPVTTPIGKGFTSVNVGLAKGARSLCQPASDSGLPNVPCRYPELNLVIVRENTESLYAGLEHVVVPGVVESLKIITEKASTRIARFAFEYSRREGRKKITCGHSIAVVERKVMMPMRDGVRSRPTSTGRRTRRQGADDLGADAVQLQLLGRAQRRAGRHDRAARPRSSAATPTSCRTSAATSSPKATTTSSARRSPTATTPSTG
jgi:hypothetical protein